MADIVAAPPARMWLADAIDPATGELASLRRGRHPVDAAVLWQFQVELGSGAALGQNGHRIRKIRKMDAPGISALKDEAKRIMLRFVSRGWVRDDGIEVDVETDTGLLSFSYYNLLAQKKASDSIKVR